MAPIPAAAVVITYNEAANIPACLAPLAAFAELVVVDSGSTDGTVALAEAAGARVVPFRWSGGYPRKKEWCLSDLRLAHRWMLLLDADERLTPELVAELRQLLAGQPARPGYVIRGRPVVAGRRLRFGHGNAKLCLLDRRRAWFPRPNDLDVAAMWEVEGHYPPHLAGRPGRLRHPLVHNDAKPRRLRWARYNRYADWEAVLRERGGLHQLEQRTASRRYAVKWLVQHVPGRPLWAWLHSYVAKLGCLDGRAGLAHAADRFVYYREIGLRQREIRRDGLAAYLIGREK